MFFSETAKKLKANLAGIFINRWSSRNIHFQSCTVCQFWEIFYEISHWCNLQEYLIDTIKCIFLEDHLLMKIPAKFAFKKPCTWLNGNLWQLVFCKSLKPCTWLNGNLSQLVFCKSLKPCTWLNGNLWQLVFCKSLKPCTWLNGNLWQLEITIQSCTGIQALTKD
jgi:hypothetical protein